jgi:adenine-specific DNA-methyltransferase
VEAIRRLLRARPSDSGYEIEIGKDFGTYRTVWTDKRYDANEYGTKILKALVPDSPFTFPKSLWSVYDCVQAVAGEDPSAIVLDFFAGSGTTGHAVWELNKDDGGHRRFILVQLPESIGEAGPYRTIADVTKARLRAASQSVKSASPLFAGDLGFRVFKLDSSNIRAWEPDRENLDQAVLNHQEHLKADRTEADILYELLLKLGLDLCVPIEQKEIAGKVVHSIGGGVLLASLAIQITGEEVEPLAQGIVTWHQTLKPAGDTTCVFRDSAFANDVAKTNLAAILYQHGLTNVRSL